MSDADPRPLLDCGLPAPREARPARVPAVQEGALELMTASGVVFAAKLEVRLLCEVEEALYEGYWNCGFEADCMWAEPLAKVQILLDRLEKGERLT